MDRVAEASLPLLPLLVDMGAVGGLLQKNGRLQLEIPRRRPRGLGRALTMIKMSGLTLGISAAIRCLSSCREKSPV